MSRLHRALTLLFALGLAGCALASGAKPAPPAPSSSVMGTERAELPVYSLGDRWIRSDGIYELIRVESDRYVFSADPGDEIQLTKDLFLMKYVSHGSVRYEFESPPVLTWPLEVGKRGSVSGTFKALYGAQSYPADLTWVVEAYEDIEVAAGKFKAFRISITVERRLNTARPSWWSPGQVVYRFWYAPEARRFVKADGEWYVRFEVIAIDPEDTAPLRVDLREPKDQARFEEAGKTAVTGNVTGGKGVAQVTISLNGEVVSREQAAANAKKAVPLNVPIALREGKNVLLVTATDPAGLASQEARTLFYDAPLRVSLPPAGQPARVSREDIVLVGTIPQPSSGSELRYSLALNDLVRIAGDVEGKSGTSFEVAMRLRDGENVVRLRFFGPDAPEKPQDWTLILDKTAAVAPVAVAAAPAAPPAGERAEPSPPPPAPAVPAAPAIATRPSVSPTPTMPPQPPAVPPPANPPPPAGATVSASPGTPSQAAGAPSPSSPPSLPAKAGQPERPPQPAAQSPPSSPVLVVSLPPLQVTLSSPRDQTRFEQDTVALAGLVSGSKGVSRVAVALNGAEISRQEEQAPRGAVAVNLPIKLREGQNTLVVTASDVDGMVSQEVRTVYFEKRVPLGVAFRYPQDMARVTEAATVVAAIVTSSKGVAKVSVNLNGTEVHQQSERSAEKSVVLTLPVKLREGVNTIGITASEPDGTVRQELRTVIFDQPQIGVAAPPPAPPPPQPTQNRWAVVIGVGVYESTDIPKLRYAVPDAEAIYQVLTGPAGFKKEHVLLLTDKTERKPTLRNIRWALGTFLARSARRDDTVVIFFAGHGAPETDLRGIERDGLAKYLIPGDADAEDLYSSALPMDELQTIFGRIEAERVVAFLDTCYSGAAGGRTFLTRRTRSSQVDDLFLERLTRSKGRAIITASRPAEVSMELPELGHGIFTYYLLEGLNGAADLNRDGIVTVQELYEYVEQQVTQKSRSVGGNQHPVMKGELEGVLPLVKVKGR